MNAQAAQPRPQAAGCDRHRIAAPGNAGMDRAGDDHPDPMKDERAVDRHAEAARGRRSNMPLGHRDKVGTLRLDAVAGPRRDAKEGRDLDARRAEQSADFGFDLVAAAGSDPVGLGDRDARVRDAEQIENFHMLDGLRHHAVIGGHDHQRVVHIADPRQHVLEEALVARHVDKADQLAVRQRHIGKTEIDREAARLLLRQPVGVDAGQRANERRLAMVDMSGRRDDHGAETGFTWYRAFFQARS
jgi:hypothetical protein